MKFCPKCRNFYDDALLVFCQRDGIPLVNINQSSELWTEGRNAIESSQKIIKKQTRIQKLQRIAKILVTTLLTMMVITVVAMNITISPLPTTNEKAVNITPSASVEPTISSTSSPKTTKTTPTPKKSETPNPKCSTEEITSSIKDSYYKDWKTNILLDEGSFKEKFITMNGIPLERQKSVEVDLNFETENITVAPNPDCISAIANLTFSWTLQPIDGLKFKTESLPDTKSYQCNKVGNKWICVTS